MPDDDLLDEHADQREGQRGEHEREPEAPSPLLDDDHAVGAEEEELAMSHVDDVHQPEDDQQPQGHQQEREREVRRVEEDDEGLRHRAGYRSVTEPRRASVTRDPRSKT